MPNWCFNNLGISGSKKDVEKVLEFIKGVPDSEGNDVVFDFNEVVPMPKELENTVSPARGKEVARQKKLAKKYGQGNWYDWRFENWGTKWNSDSGEIIDNWPCMDDRKTTKKEIHFSTAWSPPEPVVKALAMKFPKVLFVLQYFEPGMAFAGKLEAKGKSVDTSCYDEDDAEYKEMAEAFGM